MLNIKYDSRLTIRLYTIILCTKKSINDVRIRQRRSHDSNRNAPSNEASWLQLGAQPSYWQHENKICASQIVHRDRQFHSPNAPKSAAKITTLIQRVERVLIARLTNHSQGCRQKKNHVWSNVVRTLTNRRVVYDGLELLQQQGKITAESVSDWLLLATSQHNYGPRYWETLCSLARKHS